MEDVRNNLVVPLFNQAIKLIKEMDASLRGCVNNVSTTGGEVGEGMISVDRISAELRLYTEYVSCSGTYFCSLFMKKNKPDFRTMKESLYCLLNNVVLMMTVVKRFPDNYGVNYKKYLVKKVSNVIVDVLILVHNIAEYQTFLEDNDFLGKPSLFSLLTELYKSVKSVKDCYRNMTEYFFEDFTKQIGELNTLFTNLRTCYEEKKDCYFYSDAPVGEYQRSILPRWTERDDLILPKLFKIAKTIFNTCSAIANDIGRRPSRKYGYEKEVKEVPSSAVVTEWRMLSGVYDSFLFFMKAFRLFFRGLSPEVDYAVASGRIRIVLDHFTMLSQQIGMMLVSNNDSFSQRTVNLLKETSLLSISILAWDIPRDDNIVQENINRKAIFLNEKGSQEITKENMKDGNSSILKNVSVVPDLFSCTPGLLVKLPGTLTGPPNFSVRMPQKLVELPQNLVEFPPYVSDGKTPHPSLVRERNDEESSDSEFNYVEIEN